MIIKKYTADILIEKDDKKIVLEYDGGGHFVYEQEEKVIKKDQIRDQTMLQAGYKIFRIESRKDKLPTFLEIEENIKQLVDDKQSYIKIKIS